MRNCPQCSAECAPDHRFCPACGFPVGALRTAGGDPLIGRTLGGAYVILENVGSGGMGRVYRAEQVSLGKTVAVKVIHPHLISDESATSRFYTEARAASRLNHPNSVSVLDFGRTDDGLLYLVMEFLRGKDLAHVLWEEGPLPPTRTVGILRQTLAALAEAHELSIIHRDIKPENILIEPLRTGGDFVKVVDFGLAKVRADVAPSVTVPGIVCGTPDYMAPEQGRGDPLDPRSDLYSCGVLIFQVLTGRLPFEAESPTQMVLMHMTTPAPDPRSFYPSIPDALAEITLKALSKEAKDRFQSAVEFAETLSTALKKIEAEREMRTAPTGPPNTSLAGGMPCSSCGSPVVPGVKFCGECGTRVPPPGPAPATAPTVATPRPSIETPRIAVTKDDTRVPSFIGREAELDQLLQLRNNAKGGQLVAVRIVGEMGAGKRRLASAFLETARAKGDCVVMARPDVSWAGVAYAPVASCVRNCLGLAVQDDAVAWLEKFASKRRAEVDPAVRAGFQELFTEEGPAQLDGRARREGVVRALQFALLEAAAGATSLTLVVVVDQLERMDTASLSVFTALTSRPVPLPVLMIGTHTTRIEPHWINSEVIPLKGLRAAEAGVMLSAILASSGSDGSSVEIPGDEILPLHADQLGRWMLEGGGQAPARLVDLVSARFERLPPRARRAVQALALLGEATAKDLSAVLGEDFDSVTSSLLRANGWIAGEGDDAAAKYVLVHALLREVADASIPSVARSELHRRCDENLRGTEVPSEVRALHASHSDNTFQALILLERVGDRALARGDDLGAAQALRRGLERARRELVRGEVDDPERAMSIFARKLGEALLRSGEVAEAEGVLREALELLPRTNVEWARLQGVLAKTLFARGRARDAMRAIDDASKAARRIGAKAAIVELALTSAEIEMGLGNAGDAAIQLRAADDLLRQEPPSTEPRSSARSGDRAAIDTTGAKQRIEILLRLARALRSNGDDLSSGEPIVDAREIADRTDLILERSRCDAEGAERAEQLGDRRAAAAAWKRAAQAAHDAGDALAASQYREREQRLGLAAAQSA